MTHRRLPIALALLMASTLPQAYAEEPPITAPPAVTQQIAAQAGSPGPSSFADLADKLLPSVVNISSTQKVEQATSEDLPEMPQFPPGSPFEDFFEEFLNRRDGQDMPAIPPASLGSGFIIDAEHGYVITNNHVIRDAEEVRVTLHDDTTLKAEVIGHDDKTDIAVLKVEPSEKLKAVNFGNSDIMRVGDWILAIGNPFGLGGTVTAGIVSARQRDIQSGPYDDYIQTDASINRGNSGGPMFNLSGEVIGINTAIFSPSGGSVGIGFAIPSALAKPVVNQIIEFGRTRRGWLGVRIQNVTPEIAESLGLKSAEGALVASVNKGGPAESAGLKTGDVILKFNNHPIHEMRELPRIVAETNIKTSAVMEYWRDGKIETAKVEVGELEQAEEDGLIETSEGSNTPAKDQGLKIEAFGMNVSEITSAERQTYNIAPDVAGVIVSGVDDLSPAAKEGFLPGDVIVEIDQKLVKTPSEATKTIEAAQKSGKKSLLFLLNREGTVRFVALKFPEKAEEERKDKKESDKH